MYMILLSNFEILVSQHILQSYFNIKPLRTFQVQITLGLALNLGDLRSCRVHLSILYFTSWHSKASDYCKAQI